MTEPKKPARRQVSRPRLLKALLETMKEHDLGNDALAGDIIGAIEKDIVKQAMS